MKNISLLFLFVLFSCQNNRSADISQQYVMTVGDVVQLCNQVLNKTSLGGGGGVDEPLPMGHRFYDVKVEAREFLELAQDFSDDVVLKVSQEPIVTTSFHRYVETLKQMKKEEEKEKRLAQRREKKEKKSGRTILRMLNDLLHGESFSMDDHTRDKIISLKNKVKKVLEIGGDNAHFGNLDMVIKRIKDIPKKREKFFQNADASLDHFIQLAEREAELKAERKAKHLKKS